MKKGGMRCLITILLGISLGFIFPIYVGLVSASGHSPSPNFSISVSPNQGSYPPYNSTTATITVRSISGYTTRVTLSASGQPSGVTISFNPTSGNPTFYSTMTINISGTAPFGDYTITITGTADDGKVRSTSYALTVKNRWYAAGILGVGNFGVFGRIYTYDPTVISGHVVESHATWYNTSNWLEIGWKENLTYPNRFWFIGILKYGIYTRISIIPSEGIPPGEDHWLDIWNVTQPSGRDWEFLIDHTIWWRENNMSFSVGNGVTAQSESFLNPRNTFNGHHYGLSYYMVTNPGPVLSFWEGTVFGADNPYWYNKIRDDDFYTGGGFG